MSFKARDSIFLFFLVFYFFNFQKSRLEIILKLSQFQVEDFLLCMCVIYMYTHV
jgi:hypothetical protein